MSFLEEKVKTLGTSACPPYHLAIVIGGLSAEQTLKTVKYASARYYDNLHTRRASRAALLQAARALTLPPAMHPTVAAPAAARSGTWSWRRRCWP